MANRGDHNDSDGPMFSATKDGTTLHLSRDPHPGTQTYLVIEAPGLLMLFPKDCRDSEPSSELPEIEPAERPDHDAQLRYAFQVLGSRVPASVWSSSSKPQSDLVDGFRALAAQPSVRNDVAAYLAQNPSVGSAVQMLFTSLAMSARADWRSVPAQFRGVAARGGFLGRWIPTFLVLDGPVLRFLNSSAFRRQEHCTDFLRGVRSFFQAKDFMALRHAFAHWSFSWTTDGIDSEIVALSRSSSAEVRVSRKEADAFHILTFAVVEAIHDVFLRTSREVV
jgi:hypothetical protein